MKSVKKSRLTIASIVTLLLVIIGAIHWFNNVSSIQKTIWGEEFKCDESFLPIIDSRVMQRLKQIDQAGPARYLGPSLPSFSRYEHSLGVFALLKKVGVSIKEQVTGLLHDASHTVFSHVGDYIWAKNINDYAEESFQDSIHLKYLQKNSINDAVKLIGLSLNDIDIEKNSYSALEQPLPDMCADRIQYNIHTGVLLGEISKADAEEISSDLNFKDNKWFFTNPKIAKKFADLSLYFTQNFWGAKWNTSMNIHFANALKRALKLKIITTNDLFSTDRIVMNKLIKNQDHFIQLNLQQCKQPIDKIPGKRYKKEFFTPKFRGIDPLVLIESGSMQRLTELDHMFRNHYEAVKKWCKDGFEIDILIS